MTKKKSKKIDPLEARTGSLKIKQRILDNAKEIATKKKLLYVVYVEEVLENQLKIDNDLYERQGR